jgi:hypothetical protein
VVSSRSILKSLCVISTLCFHSSFELQYMW